MGSEEAITGSMLAADVLVTTGPTTAAPVTAEPVATGDQQQQSKARQESCGVCFVCLKAGKSNEEHQDMDDELIDKILEHCEDYGPGNASRDSLLVRGCFLINYDYGKKIPIWTMEHLTRETMTGDVQDRLIRNSNFRKDKDIDDKWQAIGDDYEASDYDKGHMARFSNYSSCPALARETNVYTNCSPQVGVGFNQSGGPWNRLEEYIITNLKDGIWSECWVCSGSLFLKPRILSHEGELTLPDQPKRGRHASGNTTKGRGVKQQPLAAATADQVNGGDQVKREVAGSDGDDRVKSESPFKKQKLTIEATSASEGDQETKVEEFTCRYKDFGDMAVRLQHKGRNKSSYAWAYEVIGSGVHVPTHYYKCILYKRVNGVGQEILDTEAYLMENKDWIAIKKDCNPPAHRVYPVDELYALLDYEIFVEYEDKEWIRESVLNEFMTLPQLLKLGATDKKATEETPSKRQVDDEERTLFPACYLCGHKWGSRRRGRPPFQKHMRTHHHRKWPNQLTADSPVTGILYLTASQMEEAVVPLDLRCVSPGDKAVIDILSKCKNVNWTFMGLNAPDGYTMDSTKRTKLADDEETLRTVFQRLVVPSTEGASSDSD